MNTEQLVARVAGGDIKSLARLISLVENEAEGYAALLQQLPGSPVKVTGITGPPGAGKSTLTDALIEAEVEAGKRIGVLCVDPASPFHEGALLGDRIRMNQWYNNPSVYIRSLSSRGSLGGLSPKMIEITDVMRSAAFDHIYVETVGVGQSEVEIAGLADTTVVVLVPEGGDDIQDMKAGLMEIADIFVVNKSDRPGAETFIRHLRSMCTPDFSRRAIPIIKTIATQREGIGAILSAIRQQQDQPQAADKKLRLLTEKLYRLISKKRMADLTSDILMQRIQEVMHEPGFNLYRFAETIAAS